MWSTAILVFLWSSFLAGYLLLWARFLHWGASSAKIADVSIKKVVIVTVLVVAARVIFVLAFPFTKIQIPFAIVELLLGVLIPCLAIEGVFRVRFSAAFRAWLPTLIPTVGVILVVLLLVRPFLCDAYAAPTLAMAPTLATTSGLSVDSCDGDWGPRWNDSPDREAATLFTSLRVPDESMECVGDS